jgi:hypothetical protein
VIPPINGVVTSVDDFVVAAEVLPDLIENRVLPPRDAKISPA